MGTSDLDLAFLVAPPRQGFGGCVESACDETLTDCPVEQHPNFGPLCFVQRMPPRHSVYYGFATPFRCIERMRLVFEVPGEVPLHTFAYLAARTLTRGWVVMFRPYLSPLINEANARLTVTNRTPMPAFDAHALRLEAARFPYASQDGEMTLVLCDARVPGLLYVVQHTIDGARSVDVRRRADLQPPPMWIDPVTRDEIG